MLDLFSAYARAALVRKPGLAPGATIPRLTATIAAAVPPARHVARFRAELGLPDDGCLPFLFAHAAGFPTHIRLMADPRFPLPIMGTVHVRSNITQHRPIGAMEALAIVCTIDGHRPVEKGIEFDFQTDAYAGSELVWRGLATMLARSLTKAGPVAAQPASNPSAVTDNAGAMPPTIALAKTAGRKAANTALSWRMG